MSEKQQLLGTHDMSLANGVYERQPKLNPWWPISRLLKTLWLFTESDFFTFVGPDTAFGIFGALSGPLLTTNNKPDALIILARFPLVVIYNWGNLLIFDLANQRFPECAVEDALNKPWRPLPAGRITSTQTRRLLLASLPLILATNWLLGAWKETVLLCMLTWMYNDLRGGDDDWILRNTIIGLAFGLYNEGALRVAMGHEHQITTARYQWVAIISSVIFCTVHIQDMKDQVGDRSRNRRSAPIVLGDCTARWTIAIPALFWGVACPMYWNLGPAGYAIPAGLGALVSTRILVMKTVKADRVTWQIWAGWTALLYFLPVAKNSAAITSLVWGD